VSRGRGKKNRSAKGPLGKRAAVRRLPLGHDPVAGLFAGPDPMGASQVTDGPGQRPVSLTEMIEEASAPVYTSVGGPVAESRPLLEISWVTIERWTREEAGPGGAGHGRPCRDDAESLTDPQLLEKLRGFGIELDRAGLETLCQDALSAQEVASRLIGRHLSAAERHTPESDWVWLAVLALWQRWWPAKPCLETVDDKMQEGYARLAQDRGAATDRWLDAWSDVLHLSDAAGITTVAGFDERFPLTQSLFNWNQDLEMELGNAGLDDPGKLHARIVVGEEITRRFADCDGLVGENWRRAIAEAWFWLGETAKAEQLYRSWLDDDPQWGFGWVGWASGYMPPPGKGLFTDHRRAEDLLRQGYAVSGVRDRDAIADWLRLVREEAEHPGRT
jgi:hypothetical protein